MTQVPIDARDQQEAPKNFTQAQSFAQMGSDLDQ